MGNVGQGYVHNDADFDDPTDRGAHFVVCGRDVDDGDYEEDHPEGRLDDLEDEVGERFEFAGDEEADFD